VLTAKNTHGLARTAEVKGRFYAECSSGQASIHLFCALVLLAESLIGEWREEMPVALCHWRLRAIAVFEMDGSWGRASIRINALARGKKPQNKLPSR
jgi:hypothetical protein